MCRVNEDGCIEVAHKGFIARGQRLVSVCLLSEAKAYEHYCPCKPVDCESPHIHSPINLTKQVQL